MRRAVGALGAVLLATALLVPSVGAANDPFRNLQYGLDRLQVEPAWARARGAGVVIAIVDTGVDLQHEDLRDRLLAGRDFVDGDDLPQDSNGHGTHVAGVAAASTDNGKGIAGVAPEASLLPLRVLDGEGTGMESDVVDAVRFAIQQANGLGMRLVVNLSLTDVQVQPVANSTRRIHDAVREAWFAGAVIVAAAGNEDIDTADYPAAGPNVLSVGATDAGDRRASFSNRGALVVAPGDGVVSTYWDPATPNDHDVYASGSGTSMAAPHVAGVAAILLSAGLSNEQTVERIVTTADDLGGPGRDEEFGFGRVNAARAIGVEGGGTDPGFADVPLTQDGEFEAIAPPGTNRPDVRAAAPAAGQPTEGRNTPLTVVAAALVVIAWLGTRWLGQAEAIRARRSSPWEF